MLGLVGNPEDRFSHVAAQLVIHIGNATNLARQHFLLVKQGTVTMLINDNNSHCRTVRVK